MKKTIAVLLICLVAMTGIFAAGAKEAGEKSYTFAMNCEWPPLEYVDENGEIVGFEVDLIKEMSKVSGVEMKYINTAWDTIFAGLANGQYNAVASGVTVTEERKKTIDFSDTLFTIKQSIITMKGNESLNSLESLSGKKVGVQMGTTGHFAVEANKDAVIKAYDSIGLAIEAMINGNLDACVCDSLIASDFLLANANYADKLIITGEASSEIEEIAIAVKKGDKELLDLINSSLAKLKENGTMDALYKKYNIL